MVKNIYNFSAKWSTICNLFKPIFKKISQMVEFKKFNFEEKDIDNDIDLVDKFKLKYIPTVVVTDENNDLINSFCGSTCREELIDFLKQNID